MSSGQANKCFLNSFLFKNYNISTWRVENTLLIICARETNESFTVYMPKGEGDYYGEMSSCSNADMKDTQNYTNNEQVLSR